MTSKKINFKKKVQLKRDSGYIGFAMNIAHKSGAAVQETCFTT